MREARTPVRGVLRRLRPTGDSGLTLVELMVSIVVFSLAATGIAAGFTAALKASGTDRDRVTAANLAQRELEIVRNDFNGNPDGPAELLAASYAVNPNPLPGGTVGEPLVVDGREYDVTRTIQLLPTGVGQSPCDGGSEVTYPSFEVHVEVSWPNRPASVKPVESNTALTPRKGFLDSDSAFVAVKVVGADGEPNQGRQVRLTASSGGASSTATTASDGCAVLVTTATGDHTVSLNEDGYVDTNGQQLASRLINIASAGSFQLLSFSYDREAAIPVRMVTDPLHSLPTGLDHVSLGSTVLTFGRAPHPLPGGAGTLTDLWPVMDGYSVWAGSCKQSDPAAADSVRDDPVVVPPGGTAAEVEVRLNPVTVTARRSNGTPRGNATILATPISAEECVSSETPLNLGSTDAAGVLRTSLPAGRWVLSVQSRSPYGDDWPWTPNLLPTGEHVSIEVVTT